MSEDLESEDGSNSSTDKYKNKAENLERENTRLQEHIDRVEKINNNLKELIENVVDSDDPAAFELEKIERTDELEIKSNLRSKNKKSRRHKRLSFVLNIILVSFVLLTYLILNPPSRSVVAEHEIPVMVVTITFMTIWWQTEKLIIDYELDEKYDIIESFIDVIQDGHWAPWILRACFGLASLIVFGYFWNEIRLGLINLVIDTPSNQTTTIVLLKRITEILLSDFANGVF